jgi:hypothetical protein
MSTMTFPRTMTGGLLKGVHVESAKEYHRLLKAAKRDAGIRGPMYKRPRKTKQKARPTGTYRLELKMNNGMHMVIEGTIGADSDVTDTLLTALTKLPLS